MIRQLRTQARPKDIAIIGAGPIGLEAAIYGAALGHRPVVYERLEAGANIRRWKFLELFSPWALNTSELGLATLRELELSIPDRAVCPAAGEYCDSYIEPLAAALGKSVRTGCEVVGIARSGLLKTEAIGRAERSEARFDLLLETGDAVGKTESADVVIDASGVYRNPSSLGAGGIPAPGEEKLGDLISYHIPDVLGADRQLYAGATTLLAGAGYSAATVLDAFAMLLEEEPGTGLTWARRDSRKEPLPVIENDPLPQRARLSQAANRLSESPPAGCEVLEDVVISSLRQKDGKIHVELARPQGQESKAVVVDRIISMTGYRPDNSYHRELQVHLCYASEGPMKLAAALLGGGSNGDCLAAAELPGDTLSNPEPGYYIAGHKSYGRRSDFLLQTGIGQVRDIFKLVEGDDSLDLYSELRADDQH